MAKKNDTTEPTSTTLTRNDDARKNTDYVVYDIPGGGKVWLPTSRLSMDKAPDTLEIPLIFAPGRTPKAKLTEAERAALALARKNRTPAEKAAEAAEIARKAAVRAAKAQADADKAAEAAQ